MRNKDTSVDLEEAEIALACKEMGFKKLHDGRKELIDRFEQIETKNQLLTKENESLKEQRKASSELLKFLEREWSQHKQQTRKLDRYIAQLEKNHEELENENRTLSEELSKWRSGTAEKPCSKTNAIGEPQKVKESAEKQLVEDDRIGELMKESNLLRAQLQEMEYELQSKEADARDAQQLRVENQEMQVQISNMVQRNIHLSRQLKNLTIAGDSRGYHKLAAQEKVVNLHIVNNFTRESSAPPISHCRARTCESFLFEEDQNGHDPQLEANGQSTEEHSPSSGTQPAKVQKAVQASEEFEFPAFNSQSKLKHNENQQSISFPSDALDEYLHLTAAAVKISFSKVPIASDELIQKAEKLPFYRVHDELTRYMEKKLREQQIPLNKPEQDCNQKQEPLSKKKHRLSKQWQKKSLWTHAMKQKPQPKIWRERCNTAARIQRMTFRKNRKVTFPETKSNKNGKHQPPAREFNAHHSVFKKARRLLRPL